MIQILNYPETNRVLLDGNNTEVSVTSTNGVGYYFRAKIYIDDVLFDEQSWSRADNYTATKDLIYLYNAYFNTVFNETFATGLVEQTHLIKKVNITIIEHQITNDAVVETLELPDFYILFNTKSASFNDQDKISVLGLDPEVIRVPTTGNIVIPFFINAEAEALSIVATLNDDTVIDGQAVSSFTDKRVYLYTLNLEAEAITYYHLFLTIDIIVGSTTETRTYKLIRNPHFSVKELVFQNNYGFFIPAYFDGELETQTGYKVETYEQFNDTEVVYNVDTSLKYAINTNSLLLNENALVNQIAESLLCKFKNANTFETVNTSTTTSKDYADKEHQYNTKLNFEFKSKRNQDNNGFIEAPVCDDIIINGDENVNETIAKSLFDAAFTPNTINYIVFTQLPSLGTLYGLISGIPFVVSVNEVYDYLTISSFYFIVPADEFGTPYATFKFQVREGIMYSNEATATINIAEVTGEQPPVIVVDPLLIVRLVNGSGSQLVTSVITDPNDNLDTILWEFEGEAYADTVITNETTQTPTVTVTDGEEGLFLLKCTATDTLANSTVSIIDVAVTSYVIDMESELLPESESGSETDRIYTITLDGGIEGETVDVLFDYDVYETSRYVLVNYGEDTEFMVSLLNRRQTFTYTFDNNGEILFHVLMEDNTAEDHTPLFLESKNPTGDMQVSKTKSTLVL